MGRNKKRIRELEDIVAKGLIAVQNTYEYLGEEGPLRRQEGWSLFDWETHAETLLWKKIRHRRE